MDQKLTVSDDAEIYCLMDGRVFPMGDLEEWMIAMAASQRPSWIYFYATKKAA